MFEWFLYILLGIWMSSFIKCLVFLLFELTLRLTIDGSYIISVFLYIQLILGILVSFLWIPCAWSSSQMVALYYFIYFWLTWISLFFCLIISPHFLPLWWTHWSFLYYKWDSIHIGLVYFFWTWWSLYWCEKWNHNLSVIHMLLCISLPNF